ncbi:MAG: hypothetical protein Q8933_13485 [Bacteroidota bacterium]|nr:hypothetical protein [Bacteroidota bacterium]MDP4194285.1 hypothetical protein [Bacteroidota bacterium]
MMIFADHKEDYSSDVCLNNIRTLIDRAQKASFLDHSINTDLLISFGEFESSLIDILCPEVDTSNSFTRLLRRAATIIGHIFVSSLLMKFDRLENNAEELKKIIYEISSFDQLPKSITISLPEGYAYYGLYPEMYYESAKEFVKKKKPDKAFTIGIRSIGTSLSSVISAALENDNCIVNSITLRPRGDYFNRTLKVNNELLSEIKSNADSYFLIVDEGPGLSGTSFCSAAEFLSLLGIKDEKIVLFPSWLPDASSFVSELSKRRWPMHEKYCASFESSSFGIDKIKRSFPFQNIYDISAGKWRELFFENISNSPAVFQNFEQRKYLLTEKPVLQVPKTLLKNDEEVFFLKFSGLGHYGLHLHKRALLLSDAGFSPKTYELSSGFIRFDFIKGIPLSHEDVSPQLLKRISEYLSFLKKNFSSVKPSLSFDEIREMIKINVQKGLGYEWEDYLDNLYSFNSEGFEKNIVEIDGRMLPYEWIKTKDSFIKTDSIHHHTDHLLPGRTDIAWDIAGTIVEFHLDSSNAEYLLKEYSRLSGDPLSKERLHFFMIAYLAFRLGYSCFASERLGNSSDGRNFKWLSNYYSSMLKDLLKKVMHNYSK